MLYRPKLVVSRTDFPSYRFQAQNYGTGWYHSHYQGQLLDGLNGPMITYGPSHVQYDHDLGPILVADCM